MDLICPVCGEPWDNDSLHEEVTERRNAGKFDITYSNVAVDFRQRGCAALETAFGPQDCKRGDSFRAEVSSAMFDLLGDDMDGAAAMMEDFEMFGMLD